MLRSSGYGVKHGKWWKSQLFEDNLRAFILIWVKWEQSVFSIILHPGTIYSLFKQFSILEIFKFNFLKFKFFVIYFGFISKFEWFEQLVIALHKNNNIGRSVSKILFFWLETGKTKYLISPLIHVSGNLIIFQLLYLLTVNLSAVLLK